MKKPHKITFEEWKETVTPEWFKSYPYWASIEDIYWNKYENCQENISPKEFRLKTIHDKL